MVVAVVLAAAGILVLNLVLFGVGAYFQVPLRGNRDLLAVFLVAQDLIVVTTAWLFSIVRYHVSWDRLGLRPYPAAAGCALSVGLLLASYVVRIVYGLVAVALGMRLQQQEVLTRLDTQGIGFLLTLFVGAVIAPVAEEIFFRGFLYGGLRRRIGILGAMLVSSVFFTALHLSLELFVPIFVLGLFLAWLYEYTGSLYPGILLHASNNAISLILFFLLQSSGLLPASLEGIGLWLP
jgi:membrane protease YdiL (CAAX protease family)